MPSTTQFVGVANNDVCDVVIGFDFGTSCSKVVIRTPYHYGGRAYAVPFGTLGHATSPYLLPSVLWLGEGDHVSLTRRKGATLVRDIKYHLLLQERVPATNGHAGSTYDAECAAVAFLAFALRTVREWFLREQRQLYGKHRLAWTLNLGLPSADYSKQPLFESYERIAKAAWCLSALPNQITMNVAEAVLSAPESWEFGNDNDDAEIELIPEVAAEVVGYANSDARNEGLHVLVDIGASTLDVCGFVLHKVDDGDRYSLLTTDVRRLGALELYRERVSGVRQAVDAHVSQLWNSYDPVSPMPDDMKIYVPGHKTVAKQIEEQADKYQTDCHRMMWRTIMSLKTSRDPKSPVWRGRLPVFVAGGGSAMPFYQTMISRLSDKIHGFYQDCKGINNLPIPKPELLVADVSEQTYHRLAVAWGLSYPKPDIGEVIRPSEIEDVEPTEDYKWSNVFISKEMV